MIELYAYATTFASFTVFALVYNNRLLTPSVALSGAWTFVYGVQAIFAPDLYFSGLSSAFALLFIFFFFVGEALALHRRSLRPALESAASLSSAVALRNWESRLNSITRALGWYSLGASLAYYFLLQGYSSSEAGSVILSADVREQIFAGGIAVSLPIKVGLLCAYVGHVIAMATWVKHKFRLIHLLPTIAVLVFGFSQSGRAGTIIVILQLLAAAYIKAMTGARLRRVSLWKASAGLVVFFALCGTVFIGGQMVREGGAFEIEETGRIFFTLRSYLMGGVAALGYYIDFYWDPNNLTWGRYTFSSLYNSLGIYEQAPGVYDQYALISTRGELTNVYSALRQFIEDFGVIFTMLIALGGGYVGGVAAYAAYARGSTLAGAWLIALYSWALFSPLVSLTQFNSFLVSIVLAPLLIFLSTRVRHHVVQRYSRRNNRQRSS